MHIANMSTRNILAIGKTVWEKSMSDEDIAFVKAHPGTFTRNAKGFWFNANLANPRDRAFRESRWTETTPYQAAA